MAEAGVEVEVEVVAAAAQIRRSSTRICIGGGRIPATPPVPAIDAFIPFNPELFAFGLRFQGGISTCVRPYWRLPLLAWDRDDDDGYYRHRYYRDRNYNYRPYYRPHH
jgi:hypothetical protein